MTLYLDTSLLVAALTREVRTRQIQAWLGAQDVDELAISDWVVTEFSAALSRKLRMTQIEAGQRAEALAAFARLRAESFAILPIASRHFHLAAHFADQHVPGLRAGDSLHLALCADLGATLGTLDRRLAEAGTALGVKTTIP